MFDSIPLILIQHGPETSQSRYILRQTYGLPDGGTTAAPTRHIQFNKGWFQHSGRTMNSDVASPGTIDLPLFLFTFNWMQLVRSLPA